MQYCIALFAVKRIQTSSAPVCQVLCVCARACVRACVCVCVCVCVCKTAARDVHALHHCSGDPIVVKSHH